MTSRLDKALEQFGTETHVLTDDERAAVHVGIDQANRGEFVSDAEMEAFWRRNRFTPGGAIPPA